MAYEEQTVTDPPLFAALVQVFIEKLRTSAMLSSRRAKQRCASDVVFTNSPTTT
jgi:hypothetical protein